MHQHPRNLRVGEQRSHVRIGPTAGHVIDYLGAVFQRSLRHRGMHGVDADRKTLSGKLFDHRHHSRCFDLRVDTRGTRSRRLASDIDDRGTFGGQRQPVGDGAIAVEK